LDGGTIDDKLILLKLHAQFGYLKQSLEHREVEHVPAYSHSNGWVGIGGACSDKWIVIGEIRGSQGNCNHRRRPVRLAQRSRNETSQRQALDALAKHNEQVKAHAANVLGRAADAAKQAGVPCDTMQVANAHPIRPSLRRPRTGASHGRGGLSAVVLGSVTNKVLTHSKIPVLVYR
jgi:hypothetical protein